MKKSFDAVQWMRDRRTQIDEEDRDLTRPQRRRKTRAIIMQDPLLSELCRRVVSPEALQAIVRKR